MIVKDEAPVIARCLRSVRPLIDYWVIVDTGSSDGTQAIIQTEMSGLKGQLFERPWVDFAHNRTEALALARDHADYSLVIDADDELVIDSTYALPALEAGAYTLEIADVGIVYERHQIFSNSLCWQYKGVLHEFPFCKAGHTVGKLPLTIRRNHDGRRRREPDTYRKDADLLKRALEEETDSFLVARYTFYLAQSLRDCGDLDNALNTYLSRADLGHWQEEVYVSLLEAGRLMERLSRNTDEILAVYARAQEIVPHRAEAAHAASRLCRLDGRNADGRRTALPFVELARPAQALFAEPWIYEYGLRDECSVNSYWAGYYADSLRLALESLAYEGLSAEERRRILQNANFAAKQVLATAVDAEPTIDLLPARRVLHSRHSGPAPRVLISILAKQKASVLPFFLKCIEHLDYPKGSIVLYVRTNNNTDTTKDILRDWLSLRGHLYADVEFDGADLPTRVEGMAVHDWNATRLEMIRAIRDESLTKAAKHACDFFFAADVDNFFIPSTLRELVALNLPIVAPLIREARSGSRYANYHSKIDENGYFLECQQYNDLLFRRTVGIIEQPVVHCTYLVRSDAISRLSYNDGSERFDYVIFSSTARRANIPQYLDNRNIYGYLTLHDDVPEVIERQLGAIGSWFQSDGQAHLDFRI